MCRKLLCVLVPCLVLAVAVEARAFDFFSIADLAELLGNEAGGFTPFARVLKDLVSLTDNVKEQTTILKTAYKGIDDAINMRWSDVANDVQRGLGRSYPELERLFRNIHDIEDLRYTNTQARETLRDILFATAYGPAVDYLHQQHDDMEAVASATEAIKRHEGLISGQRSILDGLKDECKKGAGACLVASQNAEIEQAKTLTDIQEILVRSADIQQNSLILRDQKVTSNFYQQMRFTEDFVEHARVLVGPALDEDCRPGHCLQQAFSGSASNVMRESRMRHRNGGVLLPLPGIKKNLIVTASRGDANG